MSADIFVEIDKLTLKFIQQIKGLKITETKNSFLKEKKFGGITLSELDSS